MTEYEKMQRGEVYLATDPSLLRELHACQDKSGSTTASAPPTPGVATR